MKMKGSAVPSAEEKKLPSGKELRLREFMDVLDESISHFDELFHEIAPTQKLGLERGPKTIQQDQLSERECETVKHFSGFLTSAKSVAYDYRIQQLPEFNQIIPEKYRKAKSTLLDPDRERKEETVNELLEDALRKEIERTAELTTDLEKKEEEVVIMNATLQEVTLAVAAIEPSKEEVESRKTRRQEAPAKEVIKRNTSQRVSYSATPSSLPPTEKNNVDKGDGSSANMNRLIGQYVKRVFDCKPYFGLLMSHDNVYYQIIYDDDDFEEMDPTEVQPFLALLKTIPQEVRHKCEKYRKKRIASAETDPPSEEDGSDEGLDDLLVQKLMNVCSERS